jgi:hypothetical protein
MQRDATINRISQPPGTPLNTIYTVTRNGERRIGERMKKEPIFDSNVIENLACSALRYRRDTQGAKAIVWAQAIAVFEYNEPTAL